MKSVVRMFGDALAKVAPKAAPKAHQHARQRARIIRQVESGQLEMAGVEDLREVLWQRQLREVA